ncbi:tape measure protein [Loktanella salsilacus]|uniref:tape measure protein n=1 Tax=Loktanella salsilacus TaxID=195913 RepID=UPI003703D41D
MAQNIDTGLVLRLEASLASFEKQMAKATASGTKTATDIENKFRRSNRGVTESSEKMARALPQHYKSIGNAANSGLGRIAFAAKRAAIALTALAAAGAAGGRWANSYVTVENRLRALGQTSDKAAEQIAGAAIRSRTPIEEMATSVMRIQKASGDGFDLTIDRVETLNKLLAAGGATAAEVGSIMTQFSQALSSGVLQGDELKSLREAAPVELLDAIAEAAGGTRAALKEMGADGELTSAVMLQALDSMQQKANEAFTQVDITAGQALSNVNSAMTVFVGRLNEGLGATSTFAEGLQDLSTWLMSNAEAAEEMGRSIQAALIVGGEISADIQAVLDSLGEKVDGITEALREGLGFPEGGLLAGDAIATVIDAVASMAGTMEGAASATREAFLQMGDAVSTGIQAAMNAVISGVESAINAVMDGIRTLAAAVDNVTAAAPFTEGTNLAGGVGSVNLGRVDNIATSNAGGSVSGAYDDGYQRASSEVQGVAEEVRTYFDGLEDRFSEVRSELAAADATREAPIPGIDGTTGTGAPTASGGGADGKSKAKKGRSKKQDTPFFEDVQKEITSLQRQIQMIGMSKAEVAELTARYGMLDEAKRRGMVVTDELTAKIDTEAAKVGQLAAEYEAAADKMKAIEDVKSGIDQIADSLANAIVQGESLGDVFGSVVQRMAADLISSGISSLIGNVFGGLIGGVGGGGGLGGAFGGARAAGGPVSGGKTYLVGERGPELFTPPGSGQIIPNNKLGGAGAGGGAMSINVNVSGANGDQHVIALVQEGVSRGLSVFDQQLPSRVKQISNDPRAS